MNKNPLITVILTTYNRAHLLPRAINSVLNQTYQNFELIIVDGCSTDNTEEVIKSFKDKRIRHYKQKENKGMLADRNKGFDLAKGDYIKVLDDDDEFVPEALEIAVNKFVELPQNEVVSLWYNCIDSETKEFTGGGINNDGYFSYEDHLCGKVHGEFWQMLNKNLINENDRFDERLWGSESILWLKLHRKFNFFYVPAPPLRIYYKNHEGNVSNFKNQLKHISRIILTQKVFLEEYGEEIKHLCPKYYGQRVGGLGFYQILNGEKLEGRRTLIKYFKFNFSLKYLILFLLSFILNKYQIIACYFKFLGMRHFLKKNCNAFLCEEEKVK